MLRRGCLRAIESRACLHSIGEGASIPRTVHASVHPVCMHSVLLPHIEVGRAERGWMRSGPCGCVAGLRESAKRVVAAVWREPLSSSDGGTRGLLSLRSFDRLHPGANIYRGCKHGSTSGARRPGPRAQSRAEGRSTTCPWCRAAANANCADNERDGRPTIPTLPPNPADAERTRASAAPVDTTRPRRPYEPVPGAACGSMAVAYHADSARPDAADSARRDAGELPVRGQPPPSDVGAPGARPVNPSIPRVPGGALAIVPLATDAERGVRVDDRRRAAAAATGPRHAAVHASGAARG